MGVLILLTQGDPWIAGSAAGHAHLLFVTRLGAISGPTDSSAAVRDQQSIEGNATRWYWAGDGAVIHIPDSMVVPQAAKRLGGAAPMPTVRLVVNPFEGSDLTERFPCVVGPASAGRALSGRLPDPRQGLR